MKDFDLEKIIEKCPDNQDFILYLALNGEHNCLKAIEEYELYGHLLNKLLKSCNDDFLLATTSLDVILGEAHISKEVVHTNLNFDEPLPFAQKICLSGDKYTRVVHAYVEISNFYINYKRKLQNIKRKKSR